MQDHAKLVLPDLEELKTAQRLICSHIAPTPQYSWPMLNQRSGLDLWVKHENHTTIGSFKIRGGINYLSQRKPESVIAATKGNHGQSIAYAAGLFGIKATIVVPHGNNPDKNAAMESFGAQLVVHGKDFDEALDHANKLAIRDGLHMVPSFHRDLIVGVATYAMELLEAVPRIDVVYNPIGLGSGICGIIAARQALNLSTEIVGVVSEHADAYAQSFASKTVVETASSNTMADGIAVRRPDPRALDLILKNVSRVVTVSDAEIEEAIRILAHDTYNIVEGAGAAGLAAALKERERLTGRRVAIVVTGGNLQIAHLLHILSAGLQSGFVR